MHVQHILRNVANRVLNRFDFFGRCRNSAFFGKDSGIELRQVLEGYDGCKVYRFLCPASMSELKAWDAHGRCIDAGFCELGKMVYDGYCGMQEEGGTLSQRMVSLSMPYPVGTFWVGEFGERRTRISASDVRKLEVHRDNLMVNPGIDGLYPAWVEREREMKANDGELASAWEETTGYCPLFSIVTPLYNTPIAFFNEMVGSVFSQTYENWELVLVNASPDNEPLRAAIDALDDPRVVKVELCENRGIAENTIKGIQESSGDYIAFLDHDDVIEPDLLYEYAALVSADPEVDLLYCDEDSISSDGLTRFSPSFKFDFNIDLMLTHNFVCHMLAVSRWAYNQVVPYDSCVDGAQDYDLTLKASRVARNMAHVPKVLYHWRQHAGSTNGGFEAAKPYVIAASKEVLSSYLAQDGIDATILPTDLPCVFEEAYPVSTDQDISICIVYETSLQLLELLQSLSSQDLGVVCDIVVAGPPIDLDADVFVPFGFGDVAEGPLDTQAVESLLSDIVGKDVTLLPLGHDVGFGKAANAAAAAAEGAYCMLLKEEARFGAYDAIGRLRDYLCREDVGLVSAKAMASDGLIYHAGLCIKGDGSVGYLNQGFVEGMGGGYHGCAECACDYSAVDSIAVMFRMVDYGDAGGFSEDYKSSLAASVDFSFRVRHAGRNVVVVPQALVNVEPIDGAWELGKSYMPEGSYDHETLWSKWDDEYRTDVLANPNYTLDNSYFNFRPQPL